MVNFTLKATSKKNSQINILVIARGIRDLRYLESGQVDLELGETVEEGGVVLAHPPLRIFKWIFKCQI